MRTTKIDLLYRIENDGTIKTEIPSWIVDKGISTYEFVLRSIVHRVESLVKRGRLKEGLTTTTTTTTETRTTSKRFATITENSVTT